MFATITLHPCEQRGRYLTHTIQCETREDTLDRVRDLFESGETIPFGFQVRTEKPDWSFQQEVNDIASEYALEALYRARSYGRGEYSPSQPWNAPGMRASDFI